MSAAELRTDFLKSLKVIQANWPDKYVPYRAAWTGNTAAQHAVLQGMLQSYSTPLGSTGGANLWPPETGISTGAFQSRWDMPRNGVMGAGADQAAAIARLGYLRCMQTFYFHGISTDVDVNNDCTPAELATFLGQLDAIADQCEFTTMGRLMGELGLFDRGAWGSDVPGIEVPVGDGSHTVSPLL